MGEACPAKPVSQPCMDREAMHSEPKLSGSSCICSALCERVLCR
jgi:hypothetical protein